MKILTGHGTACVDADRLCLLVTRTFLLFSTLGYYAHTFAQENGTRSAASFTWSNSNSNGNRTPLWATSKLEPAVANKYYNEKCGIRPPARHRRITGGKSARFGDWPWQVSVMQRRFFGFPNMHRCGGALLKASSVVTSAHCVYRLVPALLRVRLGEHDFSGTWEPNAFIERGIRRVIVHPKYDVITLENDVALLEMDAPVTYVGHIAPLCLPQTSTLLIGETGVITGWGRLRENGALPPVLQEVSVRIISNERCEAMFRNAGHSEYIPNTFICTDYISRVPASHCQGDSGGPLQIKGPDGRWFVAGIISWGISCSEPNLPAVYVRISAYKAWLKTLIN